MEAQVAGTLENVFRRKNLDARGVLLLASGVLHLRSPSGIS
ncbi:hypothetical protein [Streptomyces sirii]